jgi:zinc/manganese transport system substrate-binding protein
MGDVHPSGNPHFWLSPLAMAEASDEVTETLARIDPTNAAAYRTRAADFKRKMNELTESGRKRLADSKVTGSNARFLEYHRELSYFANAFGLESRGSIEEKPGISPSAGRIASVASLTKSEGIKIVLATPNAQRRSILKFQELSGIKVNTVAVSVNSKGAPADYPALLQAIQTAVIESVNREITK